MMGMEDWKSTLENLKRGDGIRSELSNYFKVACGCELASKDKIGKQERQYGVQPDVAGQGSQPAKTIIFLGLALSTALLIIIALLFFNTIKESPESTIKFVPVPVETHTTEVIKESTQTLITMKNLTDCTQITNDLGQTTIFCDKKARK